MKTFFGAMILAVPLLITAGPGYAALLSGPCSSYSERRWVEASAPYCQGSPNKPKVCQKWELYWCKRQGWHLIKAETRCTQCSRDEVCISGIPGCHNFDSQCNPSNEGSICNDRNDCTTNDRCEWWECKGTPVPGCGGASSVLDDYGVEFGDVPNRGSSLSVPNQAGSRSSLPPCKASPSSPNDVPCK